MQKLNEEPRGILNPNLGAQKFHLARYQPSAELAFFVEHYWTVKWDLRGQPPYRSETLPHPAIHLAVEPTSAHLVGIVTRKFTRLLHDTGWVFGIKFQPGAFYPFVQQSVATFTDKNMPLVGQFGATGTRYVDALRRASNDAARVALAEEFLCGLAVAPDENVALVKEIVATIEQVRAITKVDDLVPRFALHKRALQRLFSQYVGVSPKWVIQRYRLHEATAQVAAGEVVDWVKLALDLGYFDQAHFIKDFKAMVGATPAEYAKMTGSAPPKQEDAPATSAEAK